MSKRCFLWKGGLLDLLKPPLFNGACRRAGIEGFRFHDFRYTAVTNMKRAGIDHRTIMKITGHKTMAVFKGYDSFQVNDLTSAAHQFNTYLTLAHRSTQNHRESGSPKSLKIQETRP